MTERPTTRDVEAALLPVELDDEPLIGGAELDCPALEETLVDSDVAVEGAVPAVGVVAAVPPSVVVAALLPPALTSPALWHSPKALVTTG